MAWPLLPLFIDRFKNYLGGIMAERVDNEYVSEATIGDQRLRKDRSKIAKVVSIPSASAANVHKSVSRLVYHLQLRRKNFYDDKLLE
jgi:hypothetical protein